MWTQLLLGQSDLGLHCLSEAANISADDKSIQLFCDIPFKG